jgi:hypothetical protein
MYDYFTQLATNMLDCLMQLNDCLIVATPFKPISED